MRTARPEPNGFAAKARDLQALRDAVDQAAAVSGALWLSYIFALLYLAIAAGAVTHRDLFFENPVKLPFLNIELPLTAFFTLGPALFLIIHAYTLLHFALMAGKVRVFHTELERQIRLEDTRARLRRQLPSNIFVQFLAGPRGVRSGVFGFMLRLIAWISLMIGPVALLILFQLQFLPYHDPVVTWWHRIAVLIDLILLWVLWPRVAPVTETGLFRRCSRIGLRMIGLTGLSLLSLLVVGVATFRGEWLHDQAIVPPGPRFVPTSFDNIGWNWWDKISCRCENQTNKPTSNHETPSESCQHERSICLSFPLWSRFMNLPWEDTKPVTLHQFLVGGDVDNIAQRQKSWWSNRLVLPGVDLREHPKFGTKERIETHPTTLRMRGRRLEDAILEGAHLPKADFTGAELKRALMRSAQLQGARLVLAELQGARLVLAELQGATLFLAELQGATLFRAQLQGARLDGAELQGATLVGAELQGATLTDVLVWRAEAAKALAAGAYVENPNGVPLSPESYTELRRLITDKVPAGRQRDDALEHIARVDPDPGKKSEWTFEHWDRLEKESPPPDAHIENLVGVLRKVGCEGRGAPHVVKSLAGQIEWRFGGDRARASRLAAEFLKEEQCAGARGLPEEDKAILRQIRDRGPPPSPKKETAGK